MRKEKRKPFKTIGGLSMKNRLIYITLYALLFCGCRVTQETVVETVPEVAKPQRLYYDHVNDTSDFFTSFAGNFSCEVQGMNANGIVRIERDSILWVSVNKIVELGRVKATKDSIWGYVKVTNQYVRYSYEDLQKLFKIDVDFATLQSVLTGKGSQKRQIMVDYDDFDSIGDEEFAKKMEITLNDKRYYTVLQLRYNRIDLNMPQSYPFYIPKNASPLIGNKDEQ